MGEQVIVLTDLTKQYGKYITPNKGAAFMKLTRTETGNAPVDQLYNLKKDRGEFR